MRTSVEQKEAATELELYHALYAMAEHLSTSPDGQLLAEVTAYTTTRATEAAAAWWMNITRKRSEEFDDIASIVRQLVHMQIEPAEFTRDQMIRVSLIAASLLVERMTEGEANGLDVGRSAAKELLFCATTMRTAVRDRAQRRRILGQLVKGRIQSPPAQRGESAGQWESTEG